jgi:hypothetical protein
VLLIRLICPLTLCLGLFLLALTWPEASLVSTAGQLAFISYRDGQAQLYLMNADGSGLTVLTNHPDFDS